MKLDLNRYLLEVSDIVNSLGGGKEHLDKIYSLFDDLSIELGYIDQKRDEAETNLRVLLSSLEADANRENSPSYEQKQNGQNY